MSEQLQFVQIATATFTEATAATAPRPVTVLYGLDGAGKVWELLGSSGWRRVTDKERP